MIALLALFATLAACGSGEFEDPYAQEPTVETFAFENLADEYDVEDQDLDLYFYEEGVPYVDIDRYIELLEGAIMSDELDSKLEGDLYSIEYTLEPGEGEEDIYEETEMDLALNVDSGILTVNRLEFFSGMSEETKTDYGENLEVTDYFESTSGTVSMTLSDYGITVVEEDGSVRIPFHVANLFFSGGMYDTYYNGEKVYGIDTYQLMDTREISQTLNDTSKNSEAIPDPVKSLTYDYLALSFDYFFGLKDVNDVKDYYEALEDYRSDIEYGNDTRHYRAITDFLYAQDDIHTSPLMNGIYEDQLSFQYTLNDLGSRTRTYYEAYNNETLRAHCEAGSDVTISGDGTKAIIKVDGFDKEPMKAFEGFMDEVDSEGTVEDVVIDLSCNGGGVIGSMIEVLGYMTDEPIRFHTKSETDNSRAHSVTSYETGIEARDYDFHILSSPLSYSAANSMISLAKDNDLATIIGQDSSGGASSVMTNITPSGTVFFMSGPNIMTDEEYNSIEYGIEVDRELSLEAITDPEAVFDALP